LPTELIDFGALVDRAAHDAAGSTRVERLDLRLETPAKVHGDRQQLEQLADFAEVVSLEIKLRQRLQAVEQAQSSLEQDRSTLEQDRSTLEQDRDAARESVRTVTAELAQSRHDVAARDRYLAELGHELRGAVSPAMFAAQMLETDDRLPEDLRDIAATLTRNVRQQSELIEAILAGNANLQGNMKLTIAPIDLAKLARESHTDACAAAEAARVHLDVQASDAIVVAADVVRMRQVVTNLIANAIKFTPAGGRVSIRCECHADRCLLVVCDTGAGLSADMLERVFEPFTQAHTGDLRRDPHGGLGLGLTISRNIVQAHGGTLTVTSDGPGTGSSFRVELPLNTIDA
ncbi:MAG: HAMP domain-containing sensor histidine kinase, partial [Planctomycetota bacterium]